MKTELSNQLEIIKKEAIDLISEEELISKLNASLESRRPLILKIGFDPTTKDLHLGHTVILRKLRKLQEFGHRVCFIIGDFTARIGDPSGRLITRPILSEEEIRENAKTYTQQAFKILKPENTDIVYNSSWYKDMKISDFLSLFSTYTVARILERDDFSQRLKENKPLTVLEFIYPLIQGYDSVKCKADIEFGGVDQKFNLIVGRHMQEIFGQKSQVIVTYPLLIGLDGKNKMSKSLGNYIAINENPCEMFGKIMSISDELMWEYIRLLTDLSFSNLKNMHPKEVKLLLAQHIIKQYYSEEEAKKQKEFFEKVFSKKELPEEMPIYKISSSPIDIIEIIFSAKIVNSKNEARRLLSQGGIWIKEKDKEIVCKDKFLEIPKEGLVLKIGRKKFLKISF